MNISNNLLAMRADDGTPPVPASAQSLQFGPTAGDTDLFIPKRADGTADSQATARKFEGLLLSNLVGQMRESSGVHFFGDTPGSQVFEGLFDQFYGEALAARGGIGLAKQVSESMDRLEAARAKAAELLNSDGAIDLQS